MNKPFSLSPAERIKSKKTMDTLFRTGKAFFVYPYRIVYTLTSTTHLDVINPYPLRMAVSVPKRNFKRANRRNALKRLTRETYRLQKPEWVQWLNKAGYEMDMMFLYTNPKPLTYSEIEQSMTTVGLKLLKILSTNPFLDKETTPE